MKTRITEMFGIEHPIIQGGMHYVGFAELAAAVSNAGGLGTITGLTQKTPGDLANEIAKCNDMTDKPFAVNLTFLPTVNAPDYPGYVKAIIGGGVKIVETAGRNPQQVMPHLKDAGIKVIHKCTSVRHSLKAQSIGCDAVSVDGFECGGHPGEDDIPNMILLPRAADELEIPFVSSGGMADARSLVASLAMGAEGMNMGTRFMATKEAPIHQNVKDAIVAATELDTRLIMRPLRNTERVLTNTAVERVLATEKDRGADIKFEDILEDVAGVYPKVMIDGDMEIGAWSCGMVAGLCGLTSIGTVAIDHFQPQRSQDRSGWHGGTHGNFEDQSNADNKLAEVQLQFGWIKTFLDTLNATIDSDGNSLLNSTIFLKTNEMAIPAHRSFGMPVFVAGGGQGKLNMGHLIDYRQFDAAGVVKRPARGDFGYGGRPYNELMITIMKAMGITEAEYQRNGNPGFGDYSKFRYSPDLTFWERYFAQKDRPLPFFSNFT